jgi:two-component system response regulator NreC
MYNKPEFVTEARKRGADGYILKTDSDEVILDCLQRVHEGVYYVSSTIQDGADPQLPDLDAEAVNLQCLSKREGEVLALIAKNCTSKEISQQLRLSLRTVQNHRVNICKKLKISGPNALLKIAIENQAKL